MSLRGGFGPAVAAPSVLSVSLPSLNFVCSYLLSFCLGPRDVGVPKPRPNATVAMAAPEDWGGLNLTGAWLGGVASAGRPPWSCKVWLWRQMGLGGSSAGGGGGLSGSSWPC